MPKAGKRTLMASNSVELSTLTAERNLIYSRTGGQDLIASEARIERDEISESNTDADGAVALDSSTMATSFLPTVGEGSSIGSTTAPSKKKKRIQQSITYQGQSGLFPTSQQPCVSILLPHPLSRILLKDSKINHEANQSGSSTAPACRKSTIPCCQILDSGNFHGHLWPVDKR